MLPYINIHTHKLIDGEIIILNIPANGNLPDAKYFSYGIHPWDTEKTDIDAQLEKLVKLCKENRLAAVGEIGLDRAIKTPLDIQKEVFIKQLEIAKQYQMPVIIHCVRAWSDILSIRKKQKYANPWIFHGFNGNLQTALQIINAGCYLSFGKLLIMNNKLQESFAQLPKGNIFFETDDSDIKIEEIYKKATELYDICTDDLKAIIVENFNKVFLRNV